MSLFHSCLRFGALELPAQDLPIASFGLGVGVAQGAGVSEAIGEGEDAGPPIHGRIVGEVKAKIECGWLRMFFGAQGDLKGQNSRPDNSATNRVFLHVHAASLSVANRFVASS
jgi:hypothetical protein